MEALQRENFYREWLRLNLRYLMIGLGTGLVLSLLLSAFSEAWLSPQSFGLQLLYSTAITLCIVNCVFWSRRLFFTCQESTWLYTAVYYMSSITGMLIAIEAIHLVRARVYHQDYHFFHAGEMLPASLIVVIICTVIYVYNAQKRTLNARLQEKHLDVLRLQQMKTRAELAALQSTINPHFLYNALNAIAALVQEDAGKAEKMTLQLSELFRYSINYRQESLVAVREEMQIAATYLEIEKVRFGDRISFRIEVDPALEHLLMPRFLLQPLVENALKHGIRDRLSGAEVLIRIEYQQGLLITVADNGIPFPDELEMGYGLQSTYDKLDLLYPGRYDMLLKNTPVKQINIHLPDQHG